MLGWFLGFAVLSAIMVVFFPSMSQAGTLDQMMATMPEELKGTLGNLADLTQFDTYLASQLFDIRASILAGVMVIILALGITVSEEEKGQLRTLLALPIGRTSLLLQKWAAMAVIVAVTLLGLVLPILLLQSAVDASIALSTMAKLYVMTWLALMAIASVTFAAAIATGKRTIALLVGIVIMVGSFVISTFGASVDWLQNVDWLSLFHYFPAAEVVRSGIELKNVAVLGGVTVVPLVVAFLAFRTRDVN